VNGVTLKALNRFKPSLNKMEVSHGSGKMELLQLGKELHLQDKRVEYF
jgi:hypothetical protein